MSAVWFIPVLIVALTGAVPDNMGFEVMDEESLMPLNRTLEGAVYSRHSDSVVVFNGDRSLRLEYIEPGSFSIGEFVRPGTQRPVRGEYPFRS